MLEGLLHAHWPLSTGRPAGNVHWLVLKSLHWTLAANWGQHKTLRQAQNIEGRVIFASPLPESPWAQLVLRGSFGAAELYYPRGSSKSHFAWRLDGHKKKSFRRILALKLIRASALKVSEHLKDLNARGSNDRGLIKQDSKYLAQQE